MREQAVSITCPRCGATSYHPEDVRQGYCARCHWWTSDPQLGQIEPPGEPELADQHYRPERVVGLVVAIALFYGFVFLVAWLAGLWL